MNDRPIKNPPDREENIYRKTIDEQDLTGLAELCANVARCSYYDYALADTAHRLRVEWIRLGCSLSADKTEAEKSLKKRMEEFLAAVPGWDVEWTRVDYKKVASRGPERQPLTAQRLGKVSEKIDSICAADWSRLTHPAQSELWIRMS